ncbi:hypothetical protein HDU92_000878, partial [Lobulomyces angularis]
CGNCEKHNIECTFLEGTNKRGPQKGVKVALLSKIESLEKKLQEKELCSNPAIQNVNLDSNLSLNFSMLNSTIPNNNNNINKNFNPSSNFPKNLNSPLFPSSSSASSQNTEDSLLSFPLPTTFDLDFIESCLMGDNNNNPSILYSNNANQFDFNNSFS